MCVSEIKDAYNKLQQLQIKIFGAIYNKNAGASSDSAGTADKGNATDAEFKETKNKKD